MKMAREAMILVVFLVPSVLLCAEATWKPYSASCVERDAVFEFTEKPKVRTAGQDNYEIAFAVKGNCDATVGIIDEQGKVARHLACGVLGPNAPAPFQKNSLKQTIVWNGKDDLDNYVKDPGKLKVRVSLGLKPEFDKRLGGTSPKNLAGRVVGIAIAPDGGYVISQGFTHSNARIRKFDHDGNYVMTLTPPPADMPEEKLGGLGYVEYEPGKRSIHGPNAYSTIAGGGAFLPELGSMIKDVQPALVENRFCWVGFGLNAWRGGQADPTPLFYLYTDGGYDVPGMSGMQFSVTTQSRPRLAASPAGRWVYALLGDSPDGRMPSHPAVYRWAMGEGKLAEAFIGDPKAPGSDARHLNGPSGLDCDTAGRIYVADQANNRVQVFSPEGAHLKTIGVDRPRLVLAHQKTGAVYVLHSARVAGRSVDRVTKFGSFENPAEEFHVDDMGGSVMAVDSFTRKTRIWLAGPHSMTSDEDVRRGNLASARIYEEDGKGFRKIFDFEEEAKREAGSNWIGQFPGGYLVTGQVECDPVRETLYYRKQHRFDLKTGTYLGACKAPGGADANDIAFDKRGYMHVHWGAGGGPDTTGVSRFDPDSGEGTTDEGDKFATCREVPYDYGMEVEKRRMTGMIPTRDQPGPQGFQDGLGVNMQGDIAEICNIFYVPKTEDVGTGLAFDGFVQGELDQPVRDRCRSVGHEHARYMGQIAERLKKGEDIYSIRRAPGVALAGPTIWTFERTGELLQECAVIGGKRMAGVRIDEDRKLYFVNRWPKIVGGKAFMEGRGGTYGNGKDERNRNPFTGTLIKTGDGLCRFLFDKSPLAPIPLDHLPARSRDLADVEPGSWAAQGKGCWVDGAEWLYAGASPIIGAGCVCPTQRFALDWHKRTYVPESYRHSIGILDTNGNLIMHLGRYGNFDSGNGAQSKVPIGGDNIAVFMARYISATDNYICFDDWGERLVVLRIRYHAEEETPVPNL